ncbi:putative annexin [Medicago truncatula]|uniref:Annexin n=1 Tax=Medicago truncatula TaxID=3880 RepID=G7LF82_MEDTR|nr:annexin D3 [Medicago truncatula]AET02250.1 annexin D8 [Medicago truncatula]RHN40236.1 putative annexin [Medicago truncatula]
MASLKLPEIVPSPNTDTERLRNAFQGIGTNEKELILVLGHRNAQQRREIRETYQKLYNESLLDRLQSELSGDFRNAIVLWTCDPPERDAKFARDALKVKRKGIKQLQILVEIACASSPNHLMAVRQAYCSLFDCSLEEDIIASVSQPLTKILVGLVSSFRHDKVTVNLEVAKSEAEKLHEAINNNKLDDDHFVWILSTRNVFQIRETFASYKQLYGKTFEEDIKTCGKGDLTSLLNVVVWCIECPEKHFAKVIRDSIVGLGTDEDSLNRAIVTRAEIDLLKVRFEYANMYKSSLDDDVIGDTSGDYMEFLLTLLGKGPKGY